MFMCSLYFVLWLLNFSFYYKGINYRVFKNCLLPHVLCGFFQVFVFVFKFLFDFLSSHFHFGGFPHLSVVVTYLYLRATQKLFVHGHDFSFGLFIRVASKCQYFISLFLWCHCTSSKNRWGGRNSNLLGSGTSAHMCESIYAGGVSSDGLTYCSLTLSFHPHHLLSLHSNCVPWVLSFLRSVLKIS